MRLNPDLSPNLEDVILKALEKDCSLRYQHASEMRVDLQRLKRDAGSGVSSGKAVPQVSQALEGCQETIVVAAIQKRRLKQIHEDAMNYDRYDALERSTEWRVPDRFERNPAEFVPDSPGTLSRNANSHASNHEMGIENSHPSHCAKDIPSTW